ncbi:hypothetical protein BGX28_003945 [Mortierella sp. GBA30]|nr:hypothetical protein BGX28_003945 [Mortierella sp. GBA30]
MGVFGEKHTSLTREQKRQLIYQADTHKLRPTEVCDWVLATWGLRIARVTVYSILHKQRASLMAGHKDLYQSIQNSTSGSASSSPSSVAFTNLNSSAEDSCLDRDKNSGRVSKYRVSAGSKRSTGGTAVGDSPHPIQFPTQGEGARWEGQLKRVREPASVELDRAMVQFLKSPAAVDAHGRRLNDAELQSHALRLARTIPSASRMRCSFGWLRHFKRRLGVQWTADRFGRYRWTVEMDPFASTCSVSPKISPELASVSPPPQVEGLSVSPTVSDAAPFSVDPNLVSADTHRQSFHHRHQGKVKEELDDYDNRSAQSRPQRYYHNQQFYANGLAQSDEQEEEDEYNTSQELLGTDYDLTASTSTSAPNNISANAYAATVGHMKSISTPNSASYTPGMHLGQQYQQQQQVRLPSQSHQQQRLYSFSEASPYSAIGGSFSSVSSSISQSSQSTFLNLQSPLSSMPSSSQTSQAQTSILDSFPNLFDSLPPLQNSSSSSSNTPTPVTSSQLLLQNPTLASMTTGTSTSSGGGKLSPFPFGMAIEGGDRKVPNKDEAYDMLQSTSLSIGAYDFCFTGSRFFSELVATIIAAVERKSGNEYYYRGIHEWTERAWKCNRSRMCSYCSH